MLGCCLLSTAQAEEPSKWQILLQLDNDLFAGVDRDYTNGVRIGFVQEIPFASDAGQRMNRRLQEGADKFNQYSLQSLRLPKDGSLRFAKGFGITQLMFTPEDPQALRSPTGERPYAGWLGFEYSLHVKTNNYVNSITWSLGTTGEASFAQESQNWVHRNISDSPLFQGWDSQIPSEVTLNMHFDHKQRFRKLPKLARGSIEIDGYYEAGLSAGNFNTSAYLGALARIGYQLPASFSTPRVQLGSYGHQLFGGPHVEHSNFSALVFAGARATATAHDISLDGPLFRNFDTGIKSKSFDSELLYGVGIRYRKFELIYSQTIRSEEFANQISNPEFGSFMLRFQSGL